MSTDVLYQYSLDANYKDPHGQLTVIGIWSAGAMWLRWSWSEGGVWRVWWGCCWCVVGIRCVRISCRCQWKTASNLVKCQKPWESVPRIWMEGNGDGSIVWYWGRYLRPTELVAYMAWVANISHFHVVIITISPGRPQVKLHEVYASHLPRWCCDVPGARFAVWVIPRKPGTVNNTSGGCRIDWRTTWKIRPMCIK